MSFFLNCGKGLTSFQPLILGDLNSSNINSFQVKANSGNFSQMSNISYDTPSILMSTRADIKETSVQVQYCRFWKLSRISVSL